MLRGFILGVVLTIVAALAAGWLAVRSGFIPANADARPGGVEIWVANTALQSTLARDAPKGPNPVPLTDANLVEGVKLYADHCVLCHGNADGDASASAVAKGEYPKPPQLGVDGVEDDPEGVTWWKLRHGVRLTGMPSWSPTLSDRQLWTLALFLKHMDKLPPPAQAAWTQVRN